MLKRFKLDEKYWAIRDFAGRHAIAVVSAFAIAILVAMWAMGPKNTPEEVWPTEVCLAESNPREIETYIRKGWTIVLTGKFNGERLVCLELYGNGR